MKMMKFASEKAMALVDGQLAPAEAPTVIHEIARSPELMRQVQKYLAVHPRQLQDLYEDVAADPVPDFLIETVRKTAMGKAPRRQSAFVRKLAEFAARGREKYRVPGWSLAAGPAMAGALVAVASYMFMPTASVGAYADASMMVPSLESTVSGSSAQLVVTPQFSYRSKSDELCRMLQVDYDAARASYAVVCRKVTGNWHMMVATKPSAIKPGPADPGPRKPAYEYVDATISGQLLTGEQERAALAIPTAGSRP